jgi:uncharacterized phage protein (TIGR01671 family)
MREIKFRAWDKDTKTMRPVNKIEQTYEMFHTEKHGSYLISNQLAASMAVPGNENVEDVPVLFDIHQDIFLMQYTNLKDKNGVEVYEGDVVRRYESVADWQNREPLSHLHQVTWSKEGAWFELDHAATFADGTSWSPMNAYETERYVEVIGNILENPELLKG